MVTRKQPVQERARETRERILDTAAQLFSDAGVAGTSTNRIAAAAGMSIGTLYRYFDDKHQIVAELRTRLMADLEQSFTGSVLASIALPPEEGIVVGLRGIAAALEERRDLVLALAGDVTLGDGSLGTLENRLVVLTRAYLLHVLGPVGDDVLDVRAHLMVTVGLATTLRFGLQPPAGVDSERLVEETGRMLAAWLNEK